MFFIHCLYSLSSGGVGFCLSASTDQWVLQQNHGCSSTHSCGARDPCGCVQPLVLHQPCASKIVWVPRHMVLVMFSHRKSARGLIWGVIFLKGEHWILFFLWQVHCFWAYPILVESWKLSLWISPSGKGSTETFWFSRTSRWYRVWLQHSRLLVPAASPEPAALFAPAPLGVAELREAWAASSQEAARASSPLLWETGEDRNAAPRETGRVRRKTYFVDTVTPHHCQSLIILVLFDPVSL